MDFFLVTDVILLCLLFPAIFLNALVVYILFRQKKFSSSLRLIVFLSLSDFLHAITILPYAIYIALHWAPDHIDMDPYITLMSSTPLVMQLKVNLTLTVFVALDRALALYFPVRYRAFPQSNFANAGLLLGIVLGACDLLVEFMVSPFRRVPNCGAMGCFVSLRFREYWGTSNMVLGALVISLTVLVLARLQRLRMDQTASGSRSGSNKFAQANRTAIAFLLCSLLFLTIPSVVVGGAEIIGISLFNYIGPFYALGLLCASCSNSVILLVLNKEMRRFVRTFIRGTNSRASHLFSQRHNCEAAVSIVKPCSTSQVFTVTR